MKKLFNKKLFYLFGIIFLIGIWFLISLLLDRNSMVFPNPFITIKRMFELLGEKVTYKYLWFSFLRLLIGFGLSFIIAFLLGMLVHNNDKLYNFFKPLITFLKSAPTATFVFVFIILVNAKNAPVLVVFTVTMPILYESIVSALRNADQEVIAASKVDGASKFKQLFLIKIPLGIPFITLGLISTFGMAFKIEIMAEIITGFTNCGIGSMIHNSQLINPTELTDMFAYSLMAIIVVLVVEFLASLLQKHSRQVKKHRSGFSVSN